MIAASDWSISSHSGLYLHLLNPPIEFETLMGGGFDKIDYGSTKKKTTYHHPSLVTRLDT